MDRAALGLAGGLALSLALAAGASSSSSPPAATGAEGRAAARAQLPRGGRRLFPDHRVVAFAGTPGIPQLGALGVAPLSRALRRLERQARAYRRGGRRILPALDLIVTIASRSPGQDGRYRYRRPLTIVKRHLAAARRARALLLIHIQPGRSTFLRELRPFRRYLDEPEVGVALDPEWRVRRGQVPGKVIGSADAEEVNAVSAYLDRIVRRRRLPQKLLVVHQFTPAMIRRRQRLRQRDGVAVTVSIDGVGPRYLKQGTYRRLARAGDRLFDGFKLFYEEDGRVMTPPQVLRLRPRPDLIVYE